MRLVLSRTGQRLKCLFATNKYYLQDPLRHPVVFNYVVVQLRNFVDSSSTQCTSRLIIHSL